MTHPKTPWFAGGNKEDRNIYIGRWTDRKIYGRPVNEVIAFMGHHPDKQDEAMAIAERIVACVNFCEGYSNEQLENRSTFIFESDDPPQKLYIDPYLRNKQGGAKKFRRIKHEAKVQGL
jgi:hypothetical protein